MVAVAHRRLRLRRLLMAIERNPKLLEDEGVLMSLKIKLPIELAGMAGRLQRADEQEKRIARVGTRYDAVQGRIDEAIEAHEEHAGALEHYENKLRAKIESMVASNGDGDDLPLSDGQGSDGFGQIVTSKPAV